MKLTMTATRCWIGFNFVVVLLSLLVFPTISQGQDSAAEIFSQSGAMTPAQHFALTVKLAAIGESAAKDTAGSRPKMQSISKPPVCVLRIHGGDFVVTGEQVKIDCIVLADTNAPVNIAGRILEPGPSGRFDDLAQVRCFNVLGNQDKPATVLKKGQIIPVYETIVGSGSPIGEYSVDVLVVDYLSAGLISQAYTYFNVQNAGEFRKFQMPRLDNFRIADGQIEISGRLPNWGTYTAALVVWNNSVLPTEVACIQNICAIPINFYDWRDAYADVVIHMNEVVTSASFRVVVPGRGDPPSAPPLPGVPPSN